MSDFDKLLAGLADEVEQPEAEAPKPAGKQALRPRRAKAGGQAAAMRVDPVDPDRSQQRGARANPDNVQINANISRDLHASVFYYLKQEGGTLSGLINDLLEGYVAEQGGMIHVMYEKASKRRKG